MARYFKRIDLVLIYIPNEVMPFNIFWTLFNPFTSSGHMFITHKPVLVWTSFIVQQSYQKSHKRSIEPIHIPDGLEQSLRTWEVKTSIRMKRGYEFNMTSFTQYPFYFIFILICENCVIP